MILLKKNKKIIITPPHTASRHLHDAFCCPEIGGIKVIGQTIGGMVDHHYNKIISEWQNFECFLVVRNPYDRLIGLYLHHIWYMNEKNIPAMTWPDFIRWSENPNWIFRTTITQFMRYSNVQNYKIIRYENLVGDLYQATKLNFKLNPPYHGNHNIKEWYSDPIFVEYVNTFFAREDCEKFGYELFS